MTDTLTPFMSDWAKSRAHYMTPETIEANAALNLRGAARESIKLPHALANTLHDPLRKLIPDAQPLTGALESAVRAITHTEHAPFSPRAPYGPAWARATLRRWAIKTQGQPDN